MGRKNSGNALPQAESMKDRVNPFEQHADRYESWFERHPAAYASELAAVRELWPAEADGLEIGVGAGHFAAPLKIPRGVEPAAAMRERAIARGIAVVDGTAEHLPFPDGGFGAVLMVTAICFVDDPAQSAGEMHRVLRPGGFAVIGFVDRANLLGQKYERKRESSVFYRNAHFFSTADVTTLLTGAGFLALEYRQTLFTPPDSMQAPDPVQAGFGDGSFVVVRGWKTETTPC